MAPKSQDEREKNLEQLLRQTDLGRAIRLGRLIFYCLAPALIKRSEAQYTHDVLSQGKHI